MKQLFKRNKTWKKELGYCLFAVSYQFFCLFPVSEKRVFSVMTHDSSSTGNIRVFERYMKKRDSAYRFFHLKKEERDRMTSGKFSGFLLFFLKRPYQMARAKYVLLDNAFLPMAYFRVRKETKVIQLWHGTGTIKKFGQDATKGHLKKLEQRVNSNITHLIVNAPSLLEQYAKAFGVSKKKTFVTGLPRTDLFFCEQRRQIERERFYHRFPQLIGKKLLLYAPTFRDNEVERPKLHLDIFALGELLSDDYIILLRLHPFVAAAFRKNQKSMKQNICLVSDYSEWLDLMTVSQGLITDYSSIIFEYCLYGKPMYFYADDLEEFSNHQRGFYYSYEEFVPGPVFQSETDLAKEILQSDGEKKRKWEEKRKNFIRTYYLYQDGKSSQRIYELITKEL